MDKLLSKIAKEVPKKSNARKDLKKAIKTDKKRDSLVTKGKMKSKAC